MNPEARDDYDQWCQRQQDAASAKDACQSCRGSGCVWVHCLLHSFGKKECPSCGGTGKQKYNRVAYAAPYLDVLVKAVNNIDNKP